MTLVNRAVLEPAFVLHTRPFKETSLILDVFTKTFGKISLVAKGAKRPKSPLRAIQTPTSELLVSFSGKGDLKNLTQCEISEHYSVSSKISFSCMVYLNELIMKTLEKEDPHPEVFYQLKVLCTNLAKDNSQEQIEVELRSFELTLLQELGYGIDLRSETLSGKKIEAGLAYSFDPSLGFTALKLKEGILPQSAFLGQDIINFSVGDLRSVKTRRASKSIMRKALDFHLENKTLNIRKYFIKKKKKK